MYLHSASSVLDLIGNTPIVQLSTAVTGSRAAVYCKLEFLNPSGSIKDRMAKYIILKEQELGRIKPGDTICDNTSGNAGISIALVAAVTGNCAVITTPEKTSKEKVDLIRSFGAEVIITPNDVAADDPQHCYQLAKRLAAERGYYWLNQYDNPLNPQGHYEVTGPEIWRQFNGKLTHLIMGIGTGGTISGVARYLKEQNSKVEIIGVEPEGSLFQAMVEGRELPEPEPCKVEGIGTDKPVAAFQPQYIDRVIQISDYDSFLAARDLSAQAGLSVGGSTGTELAALRRIAPELNAKAVVLCLACDSGIRYITKQFSDEWMKEQGFEVESSAKEFQH
jgi:cystathionine beta-synthase